MLRVCSPVRLASMAAWIRRPAWARVGGARARSREVLPAGERRQASCRFACTMSLLELLSRPPVSVGFPVPAPALRPMTAADSPAICRSRSLSVLILLVCSPLRLASVASWSRLLFSPWSSDCGSTPR